MTYRDNVSALAAKLGISNDPGLREEELGIAKLLFCNYGLTVKTTIEASGMNRGGRLFFQSKSTNPNTGQPRGAIELVEIIVEAQQYFAELWESNPEPGKRPLLDAIRSLEHSSVEIVWKDGWKT